MKRVQEKEQIYITEEERIKCHRVKRAFEGQYQDDDIAVLDAGKYGFVKLQYYKVPFGFDSVTTFTNSRKLFRDLWLEWRNSQLLSWSKGTPLADMEYKEIFRCMSPKQKRAMMKKKRYFEKKAGQGKEKIWKKKRSGAGIGNILTGNP